MTKTTQEMIEKAKYNVLHNKKANEAVAKSLGITVEELHRRFVANGAYKVSKKEEE